MRRDIVLFDLDGTLVDSAPGIARALTQLCLARGAEPIDAARVRPWISLGVGPLVAHALGEHGGDAAADVAAFRTMLGAIPADPAWLYPGVSAALAELTASGLTIAVVTNKPEGLSRALLSDLGLQTGITAVVGGDSTARCKPFPDPIDHALALLRAARTHCLFVGDSEVDAAAAAATGLPFLLFTGGYGADRCRDEDV